MIDEFNVTVYMDQRDVTSWVKSVDVQQDDSMTRKFTIEMTAWHSFDENSRWDIFASYDKTSPRDEILIRRGLLDPAQRKTVSLSRKSAPKITARGYEWVWLAQRKRPTETIIFVPSFGEFDAIIQQAIDNYSEPIGEYKVWYGIDTNREAITKLMQAAGINSSVHIPSLKLAPFIMPPTKSYWKQASDLAAPFAPLPYYVRSTNTMVFADQRDAIMGAGSKMTIPDTIVDKLDARPRYRARPTRIIVRFPPWH